MPHQFEFWTTEPPTPPGELLWKSLNAEERAALIAVLVRMITRTVGPRMIPENEETEDER